MEENKINAPSDDNILETDKTDQYSTFYINDRLYGIDVIQVQEVTRAMKITPVPLAPSFVHGLINLRGQIATAIGLRQLFGLPEPENHEECMNVVCSVDGLLLSFVVDKIGDVMNVEKTNYENTPDNIPKEIKQFMSGVYKIPGNLLSIIELEKISKVIKKS